MNWMKYGFICVSLGTLAVILLSAKAQSPTSDASPKPASPPDQAAAGKSQAVDGANRSKAEAPAADFCECDGKVDPAATKKIEQALAAPLHSPGLNFADTTLEAVVEALQAEYRIPIRLDKPALEEAGVSPDTQVTFKIHDISLRSALKHLLKTHQLKYIIRDEVLVFTTKEDAETQLVMCVYSVQGLVDDADPQSMKSLVDVIQSCVSTDTWAVNGGGQAEVRPILPGLLIVSQTMAVQEEVSALLMKIRKMREQVSVVKGRTRTPEAAASHSSSGSSEKKP